MRSVDLTDPWISRSAAKVTRMIDLARDSYYFRVG